MKILVVDDHQLFIDGIRHTLEKLDDGVDVAACNCAESAIEWLESGQVFDLVLMDLVMPGVNGDSVVKRMHEKGVWVPLVVLSGEENVRTIKSVLDAGALGFIPKTFSSQQMLVALKRILEGEIYLPSDIAEKIGLLKPRRSLDIVDITKRQREVLEMMAKGYSNRQIATSLFLTEHTIKAHVSALFIALNASNRTDCVHIAQSRGLIEL